MQKERQRGNGGQKGAAYSKGKDDVVAFAGGMVLRLHGQKKGSEAWMG